MRFNIVDSHSFSSTFVNLALRFSDEKCVKNKMVVIIKGSFAESNKSSPSPFFFPSAKTRASEGGREGTTREGTRDRVDETGDALASLKCDP